MKNHPTLISLTSEHVAECHGLSKEANWNQTEADWHLLLEPGLGIGYQVDDRIIGTAVLFPYAPFFTWLSMVLVTKEWQRQGLATKLMRKCIDRAKSIGLTPVLDATPAGRQVYERLGFVDCFSISRFICDRPTDRSDEVAEPGLEHLWRTIDAEFLSGLSKFDDLTFGADRGKITGHMAEQKPEYFRVAQDREGTPAGFVIGREGLLRDHIGPLVAFDFKLAASMLLSIVNAGPTKSLVIDVPDEQPDFQALLMDLGFEWSRGFVRMTMDNTIDLGHSAFCFATAGPEFG